RPRVEDLENRLCPSHTPFLAITSYGTNSVMRYDERTGEPAPAEGQSGATFVPPRSCGLRSPLLPLYAPDGSLLVSGGEENNVLRYNPVTGACLGEFVEAGSGGLTVPTGMAFSPDRTHFYIASNFNNRILRYDYDGMTATNPVRLIQDAQLAGPVGLL